MRPRVLAVSTATLIAAAGLLPGAAMAAGENTLYVSSGNSACSDSGSGAVDAPFCSIQAAANVADPGDVINIQPGTYTPATFTRSGTAAAPIKITGSIARTFINPTSAGVNILTLSGASNVIVENLATTSPSYAGIEVDGGSNVTLRHITALGNVGETGDALHVTGGASAVEVVDSSLGRPVVIDGGATGTVLTTNVTNAPVEVSGAVNTAITSNTMSACGSAVSVANSSTGTAIENNVVEFTYTSNSYCSATTAYGIQVDATSAASTTSDYNDVYAAYGTAYYDWNGTAYATQAAFAAKVGQGAHDVDGANAVTVSEGSPIINSANSDAVGEQSTDFGGQARYLDPLVTPTGAGTYNYYDRGATQFQDPLTLVSPSFSGGATKAPVGTTMNLKASTSDTWNDTDLIYSYSVGPSGGATVTPASTGSGDAAVTFSQTGTYDVYVYVQSAKAATASRSQVGFFNVQIVPVAPLTASFTATPVLGRTVTVTDSSTDDWNITKVSYDFGDQTAAVAGSPGGATNHVYAHAGTYLVTETVTDEHGSTTTATHSVTTSEPVAGSVITWRGAPEVVNEGSGLTTPVANNIAKSATAVLPGNIGEEAAITTGGTLKLNTSNASGVWQGWLTVPQPGGTPISVSLAGMPNGTTQIVTVNSAGVLEHDIRNANGAWQSAGWGVPGGSAGFVQASIAAMPNGDAQLVAVTKGGLLEHDIRFANGSWQGWHVVSQPGVTVQNASITGMPDGSSQFVEITSTGVMKHDVRYANGSWQKSGWGSPVGSTGLSVVSIAGLYDGSSFMVAVTSSGQLEDILRRSNGTWWAWSYMDESGTGAVSDAAVGAMPTGWVQISVVGNGN